MLWVCAAKLQMQADMRKQCISSPGLWRGRPQVLRRQVHLVPQNFAINLIQLLLQAADVGVVAGDGSCQRRGQHHLQAGAPKMRFNMQYVPGLACLTYPAELPLSPHSWRSISV